MDSSYNMWREPVGYTSSSRPIRTPMRLSYGRENIGIKETRGQRFQQLSSGRESTPRTFPMELRPREFTPRYESSTHSRHSRSRSTPKEGYKDRTRSDRSSKKPDYNRSRSTPRDDLRNKMTSYGGSSRKSSSSHNQYTSRREDFKEPSCPYVRSPRKHSRSQSIPIRGLKKSITPLVHSSKNSRIYSSSHSSSREDKKTAKGSNIPETAPYGYIHSGESKKAPNGYIHATNRAPTSGDRYSSPRPRQESASTEKSARRKSPLKKVTKIREEDAQRRFLRSNSEPPRRSARIAQLKKSDTHRGTNNEQLNSASARTRTRASSRTRESPWRDNSSILKYQRSHSYYRSSSVAPSYGKKSSLTKIQMNDEKKKIEHSHKPTVSFDLPPRVSPVERMIEQSDKIDESANQSPSGVANDLHIAPSIPDERSSEDHSAILEDPDSSDHEDEENIVDIVNTEENNAMQEEEYQEEINEYSISEYGSPHEVRRCPYDNNFGQQEHISPFNPSRNYFASNDNSREVLNSSIPFHRRQMNIPHPFNNIPVMGSYHPMERRMDMPENYNIQGFLPYAGNYLYGSPSWPSTSFDYQISPVERYQQVASWQNPYDDRIQHNFFNRQTSTHVISPDGGSNEAKQSFFEGKLLAQKRSLLKRL